MKKWIKGEFKPNILRHDDLITYYPVKIYIEISIIMKIKILTQFVLTPSILPMEDTACIGII